MKKSKNSYDWLQLSTVRMTRIHFLFVLAYALQIIVFDSWNLITHDAVAQRWTAIGLLAVLTTVLWFLAKFRTGNPLFYMVLTMTLVIADIILASFNIYWERGMVSPSIILFAVPIISVAILRSRSAMLATASLCAIGFSTAAVRYFNINYGEGFRVQLWGQVGFVCALFFILAMLLMAAAGIPDSSR